MSDKSERCALLHKRLKLLRSVYRDNLKIVREEQATPGYHSDKIDWVKELMNDIIIEAREVKEEIYKQEFGDQDE